MKKTMSLLAILFAMTSINAFANSSNDDTTTNTGEEVGTVYDVNGNAEVLHNWEFIGCMWTSTDCHFEANRLGYRFHMERVDTRCPHNEFSCYGSTF